MPQVRIHTASAIDEENKNMLTQAIRDLIPRVLNIDNKIGQVMLYESEYRAIHESRDRNFVFIEVALYVGRSHELKEKLAECIIAEVCKYTAVEKNDINLVYYEITPDNYFGGTSHKYIEDLKKV